MRLHSVPPRTMRTLAAERAGLHLPGPVVSAELNSRPRQVPPAYETKTSFGLTRVPRTSGLRFGSIGTPLGTATVGGGPARGSGAYGRIYRQAVDPRRPIALVIPARPSPAGCLTTQESAATADGYLVRIVFPVPIGEAEVHWEQHGDVLEVEYLGPAFAYYHAFLVPVDTTPTVRQSGRALIFRFSQAA